MAAATNSLQKNLKEFLNRNSKQSHGRTMNSAHPSAAQVVAPADSQQGGDSIALPTIKAPQLAANEDGNMIFNTSSRGTPIYYKEETVSKDDNLYDVMILIKPK